MQVSKKSQRDKRRVTFGAQSTVCTNGENSETEGSRELTSFQVRSKRLRDEDSESEGGLKTGAGERQLPVSTASEGGRSSSGLCLERETCPTSESEGGRVTAPTRRRGRPTRVVSESESEGGRVRAPTRHR